MSITSEAVEAPVSTSAGHPGAARNTLFNVFGRAVPLLIGIPSVPFIIRGLGPDRFGLLGIIWVMLGYFGMFDLGFGRASTKFIAEFGAGGRSESVPTLVWTSLAAQTALGCVAGCIFYLLTPLFVDRILKVPVAMRAEARIAFVIIALTLPLILAGNALRAVLEGCLRFDLLNAVQIPLGSLLFVVPAVAAPLGMRLPGIVLLIVATRVLAVLAYLYLCYRTIPGLTNGVAADRRAIRDLVSFGGWVTVIGLINPILLYLDRFLIGSVLSVALVGYYTAPFEGATRVLWLFPVSLGMTLFPLSSALGAQPASKARLSELYVRSFKILFVVLSPVALLLSIFAPETLSVWLGRAFAPQGVAVLRILAVGVLINCFVHIPYSFLQGLGRPDLVAKLMLAELPLYAPLSYVLVRGFGIEGAAMAWSIRAAIEVGLLMFFAHQLFRLPLALYRERGVSHALMLFGGLATLAAATAWGQGSGVRLQVAAVSLGLVAYAGGVWRWSFDDADRRTAAALAGRLLPASSGHESISA